MEIARQGTCCDRSARDGQRLSAAQAWVPGDNFGRVAAGMMQDAESFQLSWPLPVEMVASMTFEADNRARRQWKTDCRRR